MTDAHDGCPFLTASEAPLGCKFRLLHQRVGELICIKRLKRTSRFGRLLALRRVFRLISLKSFAALEARLFS